MPRVEFSVDSDLPPDRIFAAITDFTDRRPDLWPNISRKYYEVHSTGENWAEATEGSDLLGGIWARERYEWSPGKVHATVMESNIFRSGVWELRVEPHNGGSRTNIVNHRQFKGKGLLLAPVIATVGKSAMKKDFQRTLDIIRKQGDASGGDAGGEAAPAPTESET
jgi:Polyketide cyclase / dehydrase and lipid transport